MNPDYWLGAVGSTFRLIPEFLPSLRVKKSANHVHEISAVDVNEETGS